MSILTEPHTQFRTNLQQKLQCMGRFKSPQIPAIATSMLHILCWTTSPSHLSPMLPPILQLLTKSSAKNP
ncbi:hypothetical protein M758_3G088800 [Ceratodon purpureus]|nr:hypothetical protein M758_3G088800 [Ceratodon purpureus]